MINVSMINVLSMFIKVALKWDWFYGKLCEILQKNSTDI